MNLYYNGFEIFRSMNSVILTKLIKKPFLGKLVSPSNFVEKDRWKVEIMIKEGKKWTKFLRKFLLWKFGSYYKVYYFRGRQFQVWCWSLPQTTKPDICNAVYEQRKFSYRMVDTLLRSQVAFKGMFCFDSLSETLAIFPWNHTHRFTFTLHSTVALYELPND